MSVIKVSELFGITRESACCREQRKAGNRALHDLLRLGRLSAAAYSELGFETRLASVRAAVLAGSEEGSVPIEEIVPHWPARLNRR